jgi:hypothetical protein
VRAERQGRSDSFRMELSQAYRSISDRAQRHISLSSK